MESSPIFVFDSSPLVASCQFAVGGRPVADIALSGAYVQIPPAVYKEVTQLLPLEVGVCLGTARSG